MSQSSGVTGVIDGTSFRLASSPRSSTPALPRAAATRGRKVEAAARWTSRVSAALQTPGREALALRTTASAIAFVDVGVHVNVAVAIEVLEDRHGRLGHHAADQALAAAGDGEVDLVGELQQVPDGRAVGRGDQLDRVGRQAPGLQFVGQDAVEGPVRVEGLLAAAEDHRVAALDAEGRGVGRDIGAALVEE